MASTIKKSPRTIRQELEVPLIRIAADAHVSENTARLYEADRMAVSPSSRRKLDAVYAGLGVSK